MNDYRTENDASRARLQALLHSLDTAKLARPLPNGWPAADALDHLAFWDAYALSWLHSWQKGDTLEDSTNIHTINAAVTALSRSISLDAVVPLVLENAKAVDREVETLAPALATAIEASGKNHLLFRARHRNEHLDTLESVLA